MLVNMKIVVLAGGYSPEREVSLCSGSLIANALLENGHRVLLWDLCEDVDGVENYEKLFKGKDEVEKYHYEINTKGAILIHGKKASKESQYIGRGVIELCQHADVVFMALHGSVGENGKLQAVFDLMGIRYTGSGFIGSMLAMDKELTKQILVQHNIKTPKWECIEDIKDIKGDVDISIGYPCVVKPTSCGSSIGVKMVRDKQSLVQALAEAAQYEGSVMLEEMIVGREFSVGILKEEVLPPIEIIPRNGFYDYESKYQIGKTSEICPANIGDDIKEKLQMLALKVHKLLKLSHYSRIDIMVDYKGTPYVLEANTLPGMTPTSLLPQEAKAVGITYAQLCEKIVMLAFH